MAPLEEFENRLRKNAKHLLKWAKRRGLTAFRIYDRDLPDWPFAVDLYDGRALLLEFPRRRALKDGSAQTQREAVVAAVQAVLAVAPERIFVKTHTPQPWGRTQYERTGAGSPTFPVTENGLSFEVNLGDHLDTGLFLDHRDTRARVRSEAGAKRVLNLFSYTGAFSVYAAAGGASQTVSVDLSNTYCDWAERNFRLNGLWSASQTILRADVMAWLEEAAGERFDLIVLDPPSFSTSKKMGRSFDVQRDQVRLLERVSALLARAGVLYFSTNFQGFRLEEAKLSGLAFQELTPGSLPEDIRYEAIHRCWRVTVR